MYLSSARPAAASYILRHPVSTAASGARLQTVLLLNSMTADRWIPSAWPIGTDLYIDVNQVSSIS